MINIVCRYGNLMGIIPEDANRRNLLNWTLPVPNESRTKLHKCIAHRILAGFQDDSERAVESSEKECMGECVVPCDEDTLQPMSEEVTVIPAIEEVCDVS